MVQTRVDHWTSDCIIQYWHIIFRDKGDLFPHPNPDAAAGKIPDPPFFREFPEAKLAIIKKADELLPQHELSVGNMSAYINEELLPQLHAEHNSTVTEEHH